MTYLAFEKEIKSGGLRPAYLITGSEDFLAQTAVTLLLDHLLTMEERDFNLATFYGNDADGLADSLASFPVFAARRVTVVRQAQDLDKKALANVLFYLKKPPPDGCLILWMEKKDKKKDGLYSQLQKLLIAEVECVQPKGVELKNWMTTYTVKQGKKLHPAAAERLAGINWPNIRELAGEIERLALFAGDAQTITVADIESMGGSSYLMDRFKLPDAVGNGKLGEALETIRNLEQWNMKPIQIMYDLQSLFQKLWLIEYYVKRREVGKAAGELGLHPFVVEKYTKFLSSAGPNAGGSGLIRCLEADLNVKRGIRGESLELQMLVTDLVRIIRGKKG